MSCISVKIGLQGKGSVQVDVPQRGGVSASLKRGFCSTDIVGLGTARAVIMGMGGVGAYLVCEAGRGAYLRVTPVDPVWVTMTESGVYDVRSNTNWIIE